MPSTTWAHQINPKIVEGQIHGGVAQGIGQALYEGAVYDRQRDSSLTGSMQDYAVPKSAARPTTWRPNRPSRRRPHNPLGVKGVGEAGTIAAPQAVVNAVTDALEPFGVDHRRDADDRTSASGTRSTTPRAPTDGRSEAVATDDGERAEDRRRPAADEGGEN